MNDLLSRIRVLLVAAPTYLVALAAILTIVVDELAPFADEPVVAWVVRILGILATIVGVAIAIVRRVTPVISTERGLLPPPPPRPITEAQRDAGAVSMEFLLGLVIGALVVVVLVII